MPFDSRLATRPACLNIRSSKSFITFVVAFSVFTEMFLWGLLVPVASFSLHERVNIPSDKVQYWLAVLLGIYGLASFISSPFWGYYVDRSKSRWLPFVLAVAIYIVAVLLLFLAPNVTVAVIGRILQGASNTGTWVSGLAILVDTVGQEHIGQYMGYVGIALNVGTLLGPVLGGAIFAKCGYGAVFAMMMAIAALDAILRLLLVEHDTAAEGLTGSEHGRPTQLAVDGTVVDLEAKDLKNVAVISVSSLESLSSAGTCQPQNPGLLARFWPTRTVPTALVLLTSPQFVTALWGTFVQGAIVDGILTVLPLYTAATFGWNSIGAALVMLPIALPAVAGPVFGMICDRFGTRWMTATGFLLMCPCLVLLRLVDHDSDKQKILLCSLLACLGCCIAMTLEPLMSDVTVVASELDKRRNKTGSVQHTSYAQAYGLFNMAWSVGNTIGPIWAGLIADTAGWRTMSWTLALLAGASALPALLWSGGWLFAPVVEQVDKE